MGLTTLLALDNKGRVFTVDSVLPCVRVWLLIFSPLACSFQEARPEKRRAERPAGEGTQTPLGNLFGGTGLKPVLELPVTDEIYGKGKRFRHMLIQAFLETFAECLGETLRRLFLRSVFLDRFVQQVLCRLTRKAAIQRVSELSEINSRFRESRRVRHVEDAFLREQFDH